MALRPTPLKLLEALDDFPTPPTFIPTPTTPSYPPPFNPPPSRPPVGPLPAVPGPSRLSDSDTLLFLHSTGVSRSRRSSKLSLTGHRDSIASNRSDSLLSVSTSSVRSSPQTPSSPAQSLHRPSLVFAIDEHAEANDDLLASPPLLQKAPLVEDDLSLDDFTMPIPHAVPARVARPTPPRTPHTKRESISLSSVAIPMPDSDTEPDFDALDAPQVRAGSPDITSILATTPRPRLSSLARRVSSFDEPWEEDFIDDYGKQRDTIYSVSSKANKHFTFGFPDANDSVGSLPPATTDLVWDDNQDSDSDLDLHTSLPQLMLQHGFLSPESKLLTQDKPAGLSPSPSAVSIGKKAPPKDTRDTPKRRVRHRDGKLLRGGIGLTTGLGWSDSEDEDAPSALTRRISSLNLSRSQSQLGLSRSTSLATTTRSSGFSRTTSQARRTQSEYNESDADEFGMRRARKDSAPPTSWTRRSEPASRLSRAQSQTSLGRPPSVATEDSSHTTASISTTTSAMSTFSSPLLRSRSRVLRVMAADKQKPLPRTPLNRVGSNASMIRPRAVTGVTPLTIPSARAEPLSMQSTPQPGGTPSVTPTTPQTTGIPTPGRSLRPLRLQAQPRQPVLGGDRNPVPVPAILNVGGLSSSVSSSSAMTVVVNIRNIHVALVAFPFIRTRSFAFWPWFISLRNTDDAQFLAEYANHADV
ncbi:Ribosomal protein 60S [Mycena kentingensis (nom. inval.)]|nr:Ribosomal protein 60S [Mycena kentingensis (nom. inval.)]